MKKKTLKALKSAIFASKELIKLNAEHIKIRSEITSCARDVKEASKEKDNLMTSLYEECVENFGKMILLEKIDFGEEFGVLLDEGFNEKRPEKLKKMQEIYKKLDELRKKKTEIDTKRCDATQVFVESLEVIEDSRIN